MSRRGDGDFGGGPILRRLIVRDGGDVKLYGRESERVDFGGGIYDFINGDGVDQFVDEI